MDISQTVSPRMRYRGQVLNQVYRVWLFRKLMPVLAIEILAVAGLIYGLARSVFAVFRTGCAQRESDSRVNVLRLRPFLALSVVRQWPASRVRDRPA